jgi:hypothetical protein
MQTTSILLVPATFSGKMIECLNEITLEFGRKNVKVNEVNKDDAFRLIEFRELCNDDKEAIMNICIGHNMLPIFIHGENSLATLTDATSLNLFLDK